MPQAVAVAVDWAATELSAIAANAAAAITGGNIAVDAFVSTSVYYGSQLAIYAALSLAAVPKVPKPDFGLLTVRNSVPARRRGYGRYRSGGVTALLEAREDFVLEVIAYHDGAIDAFEDVYLNDELVTVVGGVVQGGANGSYPPPQVLVDERLGTTPQSAYAPFLAKLPGYYTDAHRGDGIAHCSLSCQNGKQVHQARNFPNGKPHLSRVQRAQKVFDPRDMAQDEADPTTWTWSENPILQLLHYLAYDRGYAWDVDEQEARSFNAANWARRFGNTIAAWTAAADDCDEAVDLNEGGTEPRYRSGGEFLLDGDEKDVVNQLLLGCDGWLSPDGKGGFVVFAGKFRPTSVTITDANCRGWTLQQGVEAENQVNQIDITISDPANAYNSSEPEPWVDDTALTAAGRPRAEPLDLPWVHWFTQGRRLAKRRMARHTAAGRGTLTCDLDADPARCALGQRWLNVDLETGPGLLQNCVVEVTGNLRVSLTSGTLSFDYTIIDADLLDGWTPSTDEGAAPPDTSSPPPDDLADPVLNSGSAFYGESDANPRLTLRATGPDRADLSWRKRWRVHGTTIWTEEAWDTSIEDYPDVVLRSGFVPVSRIVDADTGGIEAQVQCQTGGGVVSEWSNALVIDTGPAGPTFDNTTITWDSKVHTFDETP